jgi:hypothetical protein
MTLTHLNKSSKLHFLDKLVAFFLVIVLAACGTPATATPSPSRPNPGSTAKKPTNPFPSPSLPSNSNNPLNPNVTKINVRAGNLLIQSAAGFQCPAAGTEQWPDQLVLASDRIIYGKDEILQMLDYFGGNAAEPSELPPTLRWVLGGSMDPIPETAPVDPETPCGATLNLTNTGNTPIQIPKVSVQLEARPQPNPYQYRLIDYCSFLPQGTPCYYPFGGGPVCSSYTASIQLGPGEQNDVFSAAPTVIGDSDCGILTLAPSAQDQLTIDFSLTPDTPKSLVYSILPIFTIDTAQGEQKLSLSHLISTLAFANVSQFSCYALQGTTFVLETPTSRRRCM